VAYQFLGPFSFGGGSDADFYHGMATYAIQNEGVNIWPYLLRGLNDWGLYSRDLIKHSIFALSLFLVPLITLKLLKSPNQEDQNSTWMAAIAVSAYPTLMYFSTDIFREVPMVVLFMLALLGVKYLQIKIAILSFERESYVWAIMTIAIVVVLYGFRFYLSLAIVIAFVVATRFRFEKPLWAPFFLLVFVLSCAYWFGVFNWMMGTYRQTYADAGSSFGVDFSQGIFAANLIRSFLACIYGFIYQGNLSVAVFILEGLPAFIASAYIFINRQYSDKFVSFLVVFFVVYAVAWIVGVDSLGTAVRYRIFNYLALLFAACVIYQNKLIVKNQIPDNV
jgi:hypothetical protein